MTRFLIDPCLGTNRRFKLKVGPVTVCRTRWFEDALEYSYHFNRFFREIITLEIYELIGDEWVHLPS
jgi:hypothetical protein